MYQLKTITNIFLIFFIVTIKICGPCLVISKPTVTNNLIVSVIILTILTLSGKSYLVVADDKVQIELKINNQANNEI